MDKKDERALVKETKALIGEVEAGNTARAAWVAIQDRVLRLSWDHTQKELAALVGKSETWVGAVLAWNPQVPADETPWAAENARRASTTGLTKLERSAKTTLRGPASRRKVFKELSPTELIDVRADVEERLDEEAERRKQEKIDRDRAAGKVTMGTVGAEQGEDPEDIRDSLTESWADGLITRVWSRAHALKRHVEKYGLVLGEVSMADSDEEAAAAEVKFLRDLENAEADIAEVRAALQERVRDRKAVTA